VTVRSLHDGAAARRPAEPRAHRTSGSRLRRINEPADAMPGQTRIASAAIGNFA